MAAWRRAMTTSAPNATHAARIRSSSVATTGARSREARRETRRERRDSRRSNACAARCCGARYRPRRRAAPTLLSVAACRACSHVCCAPARRQSSALAANAGTQAQRVCWRKPNDPRTRRTWIMGLPSMNASGLPGKRVEAQRAGMTASTRLLRPPYPSLRLNASPQPLIPGAASMAQGVGRGE